MCKAGYLVDFIHAITCKLEDKLVGLDCSGHGAIEDRGRTQIDGHSPASPETPHIHHSAPEPSTLEELWGRHTGDFLSNFLPLTFFWLIHRIYTFKEKDKEKIRGKNVITDVLGYIFIN